MKNSGSFPISAQNIDCGYTWEPPRRGGSHEYSQSMFWTEIRKLMYTPVNSGLLYKNGFKTQNDLSEDSEQTARMRRLI